jgi:hypothetical protein
MVGEVTYTHDITTSIIFFPEHQGRPMTTLAYALLGFVAGLFTMIIISLYRYLFKKTSS